MEFISVKNLIDETSYNIDFKRSEIDEEVVEILEGLENIFIIHAPNGMGKTNFLKLIYFFSNCSEENLTAALKIPFMRLAIKFNEEMYAVLEKDQSRDKFKIIILLHEENRWNYKLNAEMEISSAATDWTANAKHYKTLQDYLKDYRITLLPAQREEFTDKNLEELLSLIPDAFNKKVESLNEQECSYVHPAEKLNIQEIKKRLDNIDRLEESLEFSVTPREELKQLSEKIKRLTGDPVDEDIDLINSNLLRIEKIQNLSELMNRYLDIVNQSFGKNKISYDEGRLEIIRGRTKIEPGWLSSGEYHLLYILSHVFLAIVNQHDLVIIDEPEISLGIEWKRHFLEYLSQLSQGSPVKFLIATHSTQILGDYPRSELIRPYDEEF